MTLTEAYERLAYARSMNGILPGDAVDVILNAKCGTCKWCGEVYEGGTVANPKTLAVCEWNPRWHITHFANHGCLGWQAKETA